MKKPLINNALEEMSVDCFLEPNQTIFDASFHNEMIQINEKELKVDGSIFDKITFSGNIINSEFSNILFKNCNFSNVTIKTSSFYRVSFEDCQMVGISFINCQMKHTSFHQAKANYSTFSDLTGEEVSFEDSNFKESYFFHDEVKKLSIENSILNETQWVETSLAGIDLSTDKIDSISIKASDIRGSVIAPWQAEALINLFGIKVKY